MDSKHQTVIMGVAISTIGLLCLAIYAACGVLLMNLMHGPLVYSDPVDIALITLWPVVLMFWSIILIGIVVAAWMGGDAIWNFALAFYLRKKKEKLEND